MMHQEGLEISAGAQGTGGTLADGIINDDFDMNEDEDDYDNDSSNQAVVAEQEKNGYLTQLPPHYLMNKLQKSCDEDSDQPYAQKVKGNVSSLIP